MRFSVKQSDSRDGASWSGVPAFSQLRSWRFYPQPCSGGNITSTTPLLLWAILNRSVYDPRYGMIYAPYLDCHRAILFMPQNDTLSTFHIGGKSDDFELPQYGIEGGCKVNIDINKFHLLDVGRWSEIRYAASALNLACRDMNTKPWRSGGWLMTGENGRIKISLTEIWGGDMMGNGTDVM